MRLFHIYGRVQSRVRSRVHTGRIKMLLVSEREINSIVQ